MDNRKVAFLGAGKMGEALVSGLIRSGGRSVDEILVTCRREERARELQERYCVAPPLNTAGPGPGAGPLVLMVKPQDMEALLHQVGPRFRPEQLVITFAAGIRTS